MVRLLLLTLEGGLWRRQSVVDGDPDKFDCPVDHEDPIDGERLDDTPPAISTSTRIAAELGLATSTVCAVRGATVRRRRMAVDGSTAPTGGAAARPPQSCGPPRRPTSPSCRLCTVRCAATWPACRDDEAGGAVADPQLSLRHVVGPPTSGWRCCRTCWGRSCRYRTGSGSSCSRRSTLYETEGIMVALARDLQFHTQPHPTHSRGRGPRRPAADGAVGAGDGAPHAPRRGRVGVRPWAPLSSTYGSADRGDGRPSFVLESADDLESLEEGLTSAATAALWSRSAGRGKRQQGEATASR